MRLLLDTHVLLWSLAAPDQLTSSARSAIEDRDNELWVSAASAWELSTKHRLGKLPQADVLLLGYEEHLARLGATELAITSRHALNAGGLNWNHRDPFDRMLAAQAMIESATLVTADAAFADLAGVRLLW